MKPGLELSFLQAQPTHLLASAPSQKQPEPQGLAPLHVLSVKVGRTSFRVPSLCNPPPNCERTWASVADGVGGEVSEGGGSTYTADRGRALVEGAVRAGEGAAIVADAAAVVAAARATREGWAGRQRRGADRCE